MQLFDHTKRLLLDCRKALETQIHEHADDALVSDEVPIAIDPSLGIPGRKAGHMASIYARRHGMAPDWSTSMEALTEFCSSVLNYSYNRLTNGQPRYGDEGKIIKTYADRDMRVRVDEGELPGSVSFTAPVYELGDKAFAEALQEIDNIKSRMFDGWREGTHPTIIEKRFDSREECERMTHLFFCMATVFGMDEIAIGRSFHLSGDERELRLDKGFFARLKEREYKTETVMQEVRGR